MTILVRQARRGHVGLFWFAVACLGLIPVFLVLAVVDPRQLLGADIWFKPLKLAVSFVAYAGMLTWLLGRFPTPRLVRTGWVIVVASAIEMVLIGSQAARGTSSHFNRTTAFDATLYSVMGGTVAVIFISTFVVAALWLRERLPDRPMATAIRSGLVISLLGMSVGVVMVAFNSHSVGVPDGGPGLAFVGWSTTGGDLRIGHFVGMHALQLLPIAIAALGAAAARGGRWRALDDRALTQSAFLLAGVYTCVVLVLTWQALRGQPLLNPDLLTATVAAVTAILAAVGAALVWRSANRRMTDSDSQLELMAA